MDTIRLTLIFVALYPVVKAETNVFGGFQFVSEGKEVTSEEFNLASCDGENTDPEEILQRLIEDFQNSNVVKPNEDESFIKDKLASMHEEFCYVLKGGDSSKNIALFNKQCAGKNILTGVQNSVVKEKIKNYVEKMGIILPVEVFLCMNGTEAKYLHVNESGTWEGTGSNQKVIHYELLRSNSTIKNGTFARCQLEVEGTRYQLINFPRERVNEFCDGEGPAPVSTQSLAMKFVNYALDMMVDPSAKVIVKYRIGHTEYSPCTYITLMTSENVQGHECNGNNNIEYGICEVQVR